MPILYSMISRGITVLTKYAECVGNFVEVTEQIISKIPPENHKLTYSHGNYLIHYICEDRIIYMCITDSVRLHLKNYQLPCLYFIKLCEFINFSIVGLSTG